MKKTADTITAAAVDFDKIRDDFPVLKQKIHGKPLAYLDNAASSQMPQQVADRMHRYHTQEHANIHRGVHTLSQQATDAYEKARRRVQDFINTEYDHEIIFTSGTTDSINLVTQSFGSHFIKEGDEILLSEMEHHSNIVPWQLLAEKVGATIKVIPINSKGELIWDEFENLLSDRTAIVGIMHVSNALGTINPVKEIIAEAHKIDVPVLVDGAQAIPHMPVDVQDLDCDFYAFSSHKMCGPTGFGVLYGKEKWLEEMPPYRGGGDMIDKVSFEETTFDDLPHKFEAGTPPIVAGIGLGAAVKYLSDIGMENIARREKELLEFGTRRLNEIDGLRIIGTAGQKASVLSFVMEDIHPHDIGTILDRHGVAIRTGHHCAQTVMRHFDVSSTARASLSFYNNEDDIDQLIEGMHGVIELFGG